jgi:hypothetical protein
MRRAAKVDKNQPKIVKALRNVGACVILTHQLKNAFDCLVVYKGEIYIVEIKDGDLPPSSKKLTSGEEKCKESIELADGIYHIIYSIKDAFKMIGLIK